MHAITECVRQIKAVGSGNHATDERQLHQLAELAARAAGAPNKPSNPATKPTRYVFPHEPHDTTRRHTRSMSPLPNEHQPTEAS